MFGKFHIFFIVFTFVTIFMISAALRKQNTQTIEKFMRYITFVVLCFDPLYWFWEWRTYQSFNLANSLPLYLCSLFWIMLPIAVFSKKPLLSRMAMANICTIGILGGVFGLIFNVHLNNYPIMSFVPLRSLAYHYLMILVGTAMWCTGYYKAKTRDMLLALIPVAVLLVPCLLLNQWFGWDYCFTAGGIGTPLEKISGPLPKPLYLLVLYGGISAVAGVFFSHMNKRFQI